LTGGHTSDPGTTVRPYPGDAATLCPIAIAVGCKKCPIFAVCPVKGVIGDYAKEDPASKGGASGKPKGAAKSRK
jgi:hypothetical protein